MLTLFLLLTGFVFLLKGADMLVSGASALARKLGVSELLIGLTIVAFGTSAPEMFVNLFSVANNAPDIAIGNILGSNIANILLILGVSGIIYPLEMSKGTVWKEIPFSLLAFVVLGVLVNDTWLQGANTHLLQTGDGLILLCFFIIFLYYTASLVKRRAAIHPQTSSQNSLQGWTKTVFFLLAGLAGLMIGGQFIVESATHIARYFGLTESLIGLTIVAIGTSLPELATSAAAAFKGNSELAVGNVVGSNIFNIFWILGITSLISPLYFDQKLNFDMLFGGLASVALFAWMFIGKRRTLERWQAACMLLLYVVYIIIISNRG